MKRWAIAFALLIASVARADDACRSDTFHLVGDITPEIVPYFTAWLKTARQPLVVISSHGGQMAASQEIHAAILAKGGVRCRVGAVAMSGAFAVLQACAVREAGKGSVLMTHEPAAEWRGRMTRVQAAVFWMQLEALALQWNELCRARLKLTADEYEAKVKGRDWMMNAAAALEVGALDRVL